MSKFAIQFDSPLTSADAAARNVRVAVTSKLVGARVQKDEPKPAESEAEPDSNTPDPEHLAAIDIAIKQAQAELSSQNQLLQSTAAKFALEIAKVVLGSTDELIEQRLQQNVLRVMQRPDATTAKLYVHSTYRESIQQWLTDSSKAQLPEVDIEILVDDDLIPGDCRVDFGQSGRLASLEEQLKLVESRLHQSIRESQAGERE